MKSFLCILAAILAPLSVFAQPAFPTNVVVYPQTNGTVTLQWTPSSATNANSIVYVGVAPGVYNVSLTVSNGGSVNVNNLAPGFTYYFRVRAKDRTTGVESDPSNEAFYQMGKPSAPGQDLRTTKLTPVLQYAPFPEGPWTRGPAWETKTFLAEGDRRFFRVVVESSHGDGITRL